MAAVSSRRVYQTMSFDKRIIPEGVFLNGEFFDI